MRVIRSSGQNVSPSDDGRLYAQAFEDGLFESTTISSLGGNLVGLGAMYGIICGRDFTAEAQSVNVVLPDDGTETGFIYIQYDTTTEDVISIESSLAPFTPQYDDINTSGTICQMVIATYEANSVAVTDVTPVYSVATTKPNNDLIGSMAQIETSPTTASHAVGTYLVWNNQLYEVTSAISVGETLVVGSNVEATSVGAEISDLKSDLSLKSLYSGKTLGYYGITYSANGILLITPSALGIPQSVASVGDIVLIGVGPRYYSGKSISDNGVFITVSASDMPLGRICRVTANIVW